MQKRKPTLYDLYGGEIVDNSYSPENAVNAMFMNSIEESPAVQTLMFQEMEEAGYKPPVDTGLTYEEAKKQYDIDREGYRKLEPELIRAAMQVDPSLQLDGADRYPEAIPLKGGLTLMTPYMDEATADQRKSQIKFTLEPYTTDIFTKAQEQGKFSYEMRMPSFVYSDMKIPLLNLVKATAPITEESATLWRGNELLATAHAMEDGSFFEQIVDEIDDPDKIKASSSRSLNYTLEPWRMPGHRLPADLEDIPKAEAFQNAIYRDKGQLAHQLAWRHVIMKDPNQEHFFRADNTDKDDVEKLAKLVRSKGVERSSELQDEPGVIYRGMVDSLEPFRPTNLKGPGTSHQRSDNPLNNGISYSSFTPSAYVANGWGSGSMTRDRTLGVVRALDLKDVSHIMFGPDPGEIEVSEEDAKKSKIVELGAYGPEGESWPRLWEPKEKKAKAAPIPHQYTLQGWE